jgi:hypothetical protein
MDSPPDDIFSWIDGAARGADPAQAFNEIAQRFRQEKRYRELFDARLMHKRLELGLPLISQQAIGDVPPELQERYQQGYVEAAREVGRLLLADGHIARAWPYLRAVGETRSVAEALDTFEAPAPDTPESQETLAAAIQIAYQEGVHPRRGFELILEHYGLCRAITALSAYPQRDGRDEALTLMLRTLHREIVDNLKRAIADVEGNRPASDVIRDLVSGRDWLFENNAQYTDSSHLVAALRFSRDLRDADTLQLAVEIADYGRHLGPMFQYVDDPPFEQVYEDHVIYLTALLGTDVDQAVAHFQRKAEDAQATYYGIQAAEVLVHLLVRLKRFEEAIAAFRKYLSEVPVEDLSCPSLPQLCQMAGDFDQLKEIAKEGSEPLSYLAAIIQGRRSQENKR